MSEFILGLAIGCWVGIIIGWVMTAKTMNDAFEVDDE